MSNLDLYFFITLIILGTGIYIFYPSLDVAIKVLLKGFLIGLSIASMLIMIYRF